MELRACTGGRKARELKKCHKYRSREQVATYSGRNGGYRMVGWVVRVYEWEKQMGRGGRGCFG